MYVKLIELCLIIPSVAFGSAAAMSQQLRMAGCASRITPHFVPKRFIDTNKGQYFYYYPFGNTLAEDLLEHVPDSTPDSPSVLQLGCGDMRSCLYTLWKNFDEHCGHGNFKGGVLFYLNDKSIGVLARNVLFIHLILKLNEIPPSKVKERKRMICSIWNIWYCHDLSESQFTLLKKSLVTLSERLATRSAWCDQSNPLQHLIEFSNDETMAEIGLLFQRWASMSEEHKAKLKKQRCNTSEEVRADIEQAFVQSFGMSFLLTTQDAYSVKDEAFMKSKSVEFVSYIETGNANAEKLLALDFPDTKKVFLNSTLFENNEMYTLHCPSVPYQCYHNGFMMTKKNVKYPKGTILVEQDAFRTTPLHANSLQQFIVWVSSCASILSKSVVSAAKIKFIIYHSDALSAATDLSGTHKSLFDVIHTSNLVDHVTSLGLIVCTVPLLKDDGTLLTSSMSYEQFGYDTAYEYVEESSGLTMKALLMMGIRCLGHEGMYKDHGVICPVPAFQVLCGFDACPLYRLLIWKKIIHSTPFMYQALDQRSLATETLFICLKASILSFLCSFKPIEQIGCCSNTAMNVIVLFINQLSDKCPVREYQFWDGLCTSIQYDGALRPFLLHLQCQAVVMNIHMHLLVTEKNCPICTKTELEKCFKNLSVTFSVHQKHELYSKSRSVLITCLHPKSMDPEHIDLADLSSLPQNVFLFDSNRIVKLNDTTMKVDILMPADVLDVNQFAATLFFLNYFQQILCWNPVATVPLTLDRMDALVSLPPLSHALRPNPTFPNGRLVSLEYIKEGQYKVKISLSAKTVSALELSKLSTESVSDTEFRVVCDKDSFDLRFGLPVNYHQLKLKYSKSSRLIMIDVPCKPFNTYSRDQQPPLFYSDPGNTVAYPILKMDAHSLTTKHADVSQMMVHLDESQMIKLMQGRHFCPALPPPVKAKQSIMWLFQQSNDAFILTKKLSMYGLIAVHRRSFDIQNQTVAMDISFYIDVNGIDPAIVDRWEAMRGERGLSDLFTDVDDDVLRLLQEMFMMFHSRTRPSKIGIVHPLKKFNLDRYFRRAVLYHLTTSALYDMDISQITHEATLCTIAAQFDPSVPLLFRPNPNINLCNYCKSEVKNVLKCSKCLVAVYCGKECQVKDWKIHKKTCIKSEATPIPVKQDELQKCAYCRLKSSSLKKCTRCMKVMYCSKNCQAKDWKNHKAQCP